MGHNGNWSGERLKEAMKGANVSRKQLADATGVDVDTVTQWRRNRQRPSGDRQKIIARLVRRPVEWLNGEDVEEEPYAKFTPNPRYVREVPPRAHAVAMGYLERLQRVGVPVAELPDLERLLLDSEAGKLYKSRGELSEDDHITLIEAGWAVIVKMLWIEGKRP